MSKLWLGLGFFAQLMFSARFLVQWLASEKAGKSIMPLSLCCCWPIPFIEKTRYLFWVSPWEFLFTAAICT